MSDLCFCFFKQKTAYEMRISDWSSDVCSSDLAITSTGNIISGCSNFMQLYNFSNVFSFIYGQSLHAHALFGGAGMNVLCGLAFCIWWMIPLSEIGRASCRERVCQYV